VTDPPWDVVFFSSVDFRSHAQRPQAVARELAARGSRVLYIDNIGLRLPRLSDRRRVARRLRAAREPAAPGPITVVSPLTPPLDHWRPVRALAHRRLSKRIASWRRDRPVVVWTYLPNPVIGDVAQTSGADALVYEYADLASARLDARSERHRARVASWEDAMFDRATCVFVPSDQLRDARGITSANAHVVPHGTPSPPSQPHAPLVAGVARPRIAFVGSISAVVDIALLDDLARTHPEWSLVIVGPAHVPLKSLEHRPNVVLTGEIDSDAVAAVLEGCDVGLIPYRLDRGGVDAISPLKLTEYRAHGLPVVSVDIPAVHDRDGVEIARGTDGFSSAIQCALAAGRSPAERGPTWADTVGAMVEMVRTRVT